MKSNIPKLLKKHKMSAHKLSTVTGIPYPTVWRMSKGHVPKYNRESIAARLCEAFQCTPEELFE